MSLHFLAPNRRHADPAHGAPREDLLYFSHRRWQDVSCGRRNLLARAGRTRTVAFVEPPVPDAVHPFVATTRDGGVAVIAPHVPAGGPVDVHARVLLDFVLSALGIRRFSCWYDTPAGLKLSAHLSPQAVVYDSIDERIETHPRLLLRADLVLTGLECAEAARSRHGRVVGVLSSRDREHYAQARGRSTEPADQRSIPHPRIGILAAPEGVDRDLLLATARLVPGWHFVVLAAAPLRTAKHQPAPSNVHWLGPRPYGALPEYVSSWEVGMIPAARAPGAGVLETALQFIAAGIPVVATPDAKLQPLSSTPGLTMLADTPEGVVSAIGDALCELRAPWLAKADAFLADQCWDLTWASIDAELRAISAPAISAPVISRGAARLPWRR